MQCICPAGYHQCLGTECIRQRQNRLLHKEFEFAVIEIRGHRQVPRRAGRPVLHQAGMRPAFFLMNGNRQHPRIIGESILNTIAMMRIQINVKHSLNAFRQKRQD